MIDIKSLNFLSTDAFNVQVNIKVFNNNDALIIYNQLDDTLYVCNNYVTMILFLLVTQYMIEI